MMQFVFSICFALFCFTGPLNARQVSPNITPRELEQFNEALDKELHESQERVQAAIEQFSSAKSAFDPAANIKVKALKGALQTKVILVNRFRDAPSIQSPLVRRTLLQILRKQYVDISDLQHLDAIVRQERSREQSE